MDLTANEKRDADKLIEAGNPLSGKYRFLWHIHYKPQKHQSLPVSTTPVSGVPRYPLTRNIPHHISLRHSYRYPPLNFRYLFEDNRNWGAFRLAEKDDFRDVEITEVNKIAS